MEQAKVSSSFSQSAQSADEDAAAAADHRVVQHVEPSPSLSRCHNRRQMFAQKQRRRKKNNSRHNNLERRKPQTVQWPLTLSLFAAATEIVSLTPSISHNITSALS